ncbi:putative ABC transport system permease protein [Catalinimonas alkaloidigena]|uniref:ABC transporter permease n=1 Tax=Catalinimonas alkaloidigena TaxID=1075417 RepID=UPI00240750B1|nr:ABC transporter permease [Catalinimonas alkaloidigena]MDF9800167.1 putative ABC transport system permease protein [Catalinimonas alkaloidigena]
MQPPKQPPRHAQQFLRGFCDPDLVSEIEGDLYEMYRGWVLHKGCRKADFLYWLHVLSFFRPYFIAKRKVTLHPNHSLMIKNYFFIAYRNLSKHKSFTLINISGLAIGVTAALIIALYAFNELTYDRFHPLADRIFMVYKERITPNGVQPTYDTWLPLTARLESEYPEIEMTAHSFVDNVRVSLDDKQFEAEAMFADPEILKMFNFPQVEGNVDHVFSSLNEAVITEETAQKFFGDEDPLGKTITLDFALQYTVSGVLADIPQNSSLQFDLVVPIKSTPDYQELSENWGSSFLSSYVLLPDASSAERLEAKFPDFIAQVWGEDEPQKTNFKLLPLTDAYDTFVGDSHNIYVLLVIAIGIILIASVNFMNLSTARSLERMREIGMRKTFGARRSQLIYQFISEAVLLCLASVLIGIMLTMIILPYFNQQFGTALVFPLSDIRVLILLISFGLLLGFFSGSYPAFFLSRFKIIQSLRGKLRSKQGGIGLRNALVVLQFTVSIFLIGSALTVWQQLSFMQNADMAFDKENIILMPLGLGSFEGSAQDSARLEVFKTQLLAHPDIVSVSSSSHIPSDWAGWFTFVQPKGWEGDPMRMRYTFADAAYFQTLGIEIQEGRMFHEDSQNDRNEAVILNEAAMQAFGWENIENKVIDMGRSEYQLVGLAEDYHFESLRNEVAPILHFYRAPDNGVHNYVTARIQTKDYRGMLNFLEAQWEALNTGRPFDFSFMDEQVARMYEAEDRLLGIVTAFSGVAIAIACMGLLGLSQYTLQKRRKEIGIRKVLGASVGKILLMVGRDFTLLILLSLLIAVPFTYWLLHEWLQDFAYRIEVNVLLLAGVGSVALFIAWLTISFQSIKAAQANPVDSLRDE